MRVQYTSSNGFIYQLDQRTWKAGEMKVQDVLVHPEWLRVAEWVRDHLDCKTYAEAYEDRHPYKKKPHQSFVCYTHSQTCSSLDLRHAGAKKGKWCMYVNLEKNADLSQRCSN